MGRNISHFMAVMYDARGVIYTVAAIRFVENAVSVGW